MRIYPLALAVCAFLGASIFSSVHAAQPVAVCILTTGHTGCANELTPAGVSTAQESGHLVRNKPGVMAGFQVNNWNTAAGVTLMVLDGTSVPANGTLTACTYTNGTANINPCIMKWYGVPTAPSATQPATVSASWAPGPFLHFLNGIVLVCSSTGPTTLTLASTCTFSSDVE